MHDCPATGSSRHISVGTATYLESDVPNPYLLSLALSLIVKVAKSGGLGWLFGRLPQELGDSSNGGSPDLQQVSRAAAALTSSASKIAPSVKNYALEPAEEDVFLSLARRLESQSAKLQSQARRGDLSGARLSLRQISSTCNSCHALFRDYSPTINLSR